MLNVYHSIHNPTFFLCIHTFIIFHILLPHRVSQNIASSSLCYKTCPNWLVHEWIQKQDSYTCCLYLFYFLAFILSMITWFTLFYKFLLKCDYNCSFGTYTFNRQIVWNYKRWKDSEYSVINTLMWQEIQEKKLGNLLF